MERKGTTGRRDAVKLRARVGAAQNPAGGDQAPPVSLLLMISMDGRPSKRMLHGSGDASGDVVQNLECSSRMK